MTPDAKGLCVFAIKRGNIESRIDINYNLPKYTELIKKLKESFGNQLRRIGDIADVICGPFGSAIKNTDYQEEGIPLVRITNISKDGYMDYSEVVYISEQLGDSLKRTQVFPGDLVVSQRGSLGQCAIVDNTYQKLNISANIIAIKHIQKTSAEFVRDYVLSSLGQLQLERSTSGQVQQKITTQDIADILLPIDCDEKELVERVEKKRQERNQKLQRADSLLRNMDSFIHSTLSIPGIAFCETIISAVRMSDLREDDTFSAKYYHPERMAAIHVIKASGPVKKLSEVVDFHRDIVDSAKSTKDYLGLAGVESQTGELSGVVEDAAGQAFIYYEGDVLYGRLRPYLNKVLFAEQSGICSTEFHVMRVKNEDEVLPEYIAAILRSDLILSQTKHMMTGNTHPRISNDDVKNLFIPVPDISVQRVIVDELHMLRQKARILRTEATQEWQAAKQQFEKELLGV